MLRRGFYCAQPMYYPCPSPLHKSFIALQNNYIELFTIVMYTKLKNTL